MKHTFKFLIILLIAWLWLPTGTSDFFIIPWIIAKIGKTAYMIVSVILVVWLWNNIEGKGVSGKISTIGKELSHLFN